MIAPAALGPSVAGFLPHQRWYEGTQEPRAVTVVRQRVLRGERPALVDLIVDADGAEYHLLVGLRPATERPELLRGHDDQVLSELVTDDGPVLAYDALLDGELMLLFLDLVTESGERAERVRPVGAEQSNSSVVYDDRLILKVFRHLHRGPNPEVEVTSALARVGFSHVAAPLATWTDDGYDLAILQPFLSGGSEGWTLALNSLRDLFGLHDTQSVPLIDRDAPPPETDPGEAGGDFSAEAERLGGVTADLHLALAEAFGQQRGDVDAWATGVDAQVDRVPASDMDPRATRRVIDDLRRVRDPGAAIRIHGDYHLGQVMRTDAGWFVIDFEGEPLRPLEERRRPSSPLRDVAGMLRSFHYASIVALEDRDEVGVAAAWEDRNRRAFLEGYLAEAKKGSLLPADQSSVEAVLAAFEVEKAAYELVYEQAHRPQWARIPRSALRRLAAGRVR